MMHVSTTHVSAPHAPEFHAPGLLSRTWHSLLNQIVQPAPGNADFCEFDCRHRQCMLETAGRCDLQPSQTLVLIRTTLASRPARWTPMPHTGASTPIPPAHAA